MDLRDFPGFTESEKRKRSLARTRTINFSFLFYVRRADIVSYENMRSGQHYIRRNKSFQRKLERTKYGVQRTMEGF